MLAKTKIYEVVTGKTADEKLSTLQNFKRDLKEDATGVCLNTAIVASLAVVIGMVGTGAVNSSKRDIATAKMDFGNVQIIKTHNNDKFQQNFKLQDGKSGVIVAQKNAGTNSCGYTVSMTDGSLADSSTTEKEVISRRAQYVASKCEDGKDNIGDLIPYLYLLRNLF